MLALLICAVLATTPVDEFCRSQFGHPGDLGVSQTAEQYFARGTTYAEIAATIGALGVEVPSNDANLRVYRWQDGQLEMLFYHDRLAMYRMNDRWSVAGKRVGLEMQQQDFDVQASHDETRRQEYEDFYGKVEGIVRAGTQVAEGQTEQTDIRALQFYLRKLERAINASDWSQAEELRERMSFALQRSHLVAVDAERRLTEREREEEERRHKEEIQQRDRIHQAEMEGQEKILSALQNLPNN